MLKCAMERHDWDDQSVTEWVHELGVIAGLRRVEIKSRGDRVEVSVSFKCPHGSKYITPYQPRLWSEDRSLAKVGTLESRERQ